MSSSTVLSPAARITAALIALLAIASLQLQYVLLLEQVRHTVGSMVGTLRFLGYFTVLSNILVAAVTVYAVAGLGGFLSRSRVRAGVALYIAVTGLVYFLVLRHLWQPQGAQWWADTGLHYAVPVAYVAWWLALVPHGALRGMDLLKWLLFPLCYLGWALLLGARYGQYPYPFIDLAQLGWARTLANAFGVLCLFLLLGGLVLFLDRKLARRHATA
jgi:hypothetical protein